MVFFRIGPAEEARPVVQGEGLYLRPARLGDFEAWVDLRRSSARFLAPWEPVWPVDDLTRTAFKRRLRRYDEEIRTDAAYPYLVFRDGDEAMLGGLTLGQVRRGVAQTATLGYWIGERHAGRGHMTRAVRAAARHAFAGLGLRRIEAACLPENAASMRLLEKVGFRFEGVAREYLCIAGAWRDHRLYALLASDPMG